MPTLENGGVSEDLKTVTWKLKAGSSSGRMANRLPRDDVQIHLGGGACTGQRRLPWPADYALITDVQTPDPETAVVTYSEFNAGYLDQFPWILPTPARLDPPRRWLTWDFNRNPIGTGPFQLARVGVRASIMHDCRATRTIREEGKPVARWARRS